MFAPRYFDFNANTPLDARVLEAMLPYLRERFGNASSRHEYGRQARAAIDQARAQVAALVNAHASEVVFTSGGSEANNLFIKGAAGKRPGVVAIGATEHPCVREPAHQLREAGWRVLELPVGAQGHLDVASAAAMIIAERPAIVSVMLANNECGALNDVAGLLPAVREVAACLHSDAVQAVGKLAVDFRALNVHALSLSSHKIGGPIGAGALILDKRVDLSPLIAGGGHERGLRSGTENVAAIVGFGKAAELARQELAQRVQNMRAARDCFEAGLSAMASSELQRFATGGERLPNTSFFAFAGIDGETLVAKLDRAGFAVASGAACSSAQPEPSRTLLAMQVSPEIARGAVRVSMGAATNLEDVEALLQALHDTVSQLKNLAAVAV